MEKFNLDDYGVSIPDLLRVAESKYRLVYKHGSYWHMACDGVESGQTYQQMQEAVNLLEKKGEDEIVITGNLVVLRGKQFMQTARSYKVQFPPFTEPPAIGIIEILGLLPPTAFRDPADLDPYISFFVSWDPERNYVLEFTPLFLKKES